MSSSGMLVCGISPPRRIKIGIYLDTCRKEKTRELSV
jgi:hypothetical protein